MDKSPWLCVQVPRWLVHNCCWWGSLYQSQWRWLWVWVCLAASVLTQALGGGVTVSLSASLKQLLSCQLELQNLDCSSQLSKLVVAIPEQVDAAPADFQVFQRLPIGCRTAATAIGPCWGSSPLPFSWNPVPSSLTMARLEEAEQLAHGAPNQRHPVVQVPSWWYGLRYHEKYDIKQHKYHK